MYAVTRLSLFLVAIISLSLLAACQGGSSAGGGSPSKTGDFQWLPLFGDGANDGSEIIARVGDIEISVRDMELYREELSASMQKSFEGPDGEHLLAKQMVEKVLLIQGAVERELYNDPDVARSIIAARRTLLESAMINYGLLKNQKPSDEEAREYFMNHRIQYRQLGLVNARHIECLDKVAADKAYERLVAGGKGNDWMSVMAATSVNEVSREQEGSVGWFNDNGVIPFLADSAAFIDKAFDLAVGLHPPFQINDRWHVVEIMKRENERPMTFNEAKSKVVEEMLPVWQDDRIRNYMRDARRQTEIEMMGKFAPGQGLSPDELFNQALAVVDVGRKIELLNLIHSDYPESDRADDALFLAATFALDGNRDLRLADRYLILLLDEYPDSELVEDAQFLKDNLYNPEVMNPESIEELRKTD